MAGCLFPPELQFQAQEVAQKGCRPAVGGRFLLVVQVQQALAEALLVSLQALLAARLAAWLQPRVQAGL